MRTPTPMSRISRRACFGLLSAPAAAVCSEWTEFLGGRRSLPAGASLPLHWSEERNLAWSAVPAGYGQSSPVVLDDRVFVTSIDGPSKERLILSVYGLEDGKLLWERRAAPAEPAEVTDMVSKAAPTPAVDELGVYTFFETGNVSAFDHSGSLSWERRLTDELGAFGGRHGIGSSLRLCDAGVLVLADHDGPSYLLCLNRTNGKTVWKTDRPSSVAWSTPSIVRRAGIELALVSSQQGLDAYDLSDGMRAWTLDGIEGAMIASPTPMPRGAVTGSSNKGQTAAIRFGEDLKSPPETLWRADEAASYFSSPLLHRGRVYMVNKAGVAFCLDAESGAEIWHQRLRGPCWASSCGCGEAVYFFGVDGDVEVFRAVDAPFKLAENKLREDSRLYGYAVASDRMILRYGRRLACVAESV